MPGQGPYGQGKPEHGKPAHGKPGHGKPAYGKPAHGKLGHTKPGQGQQGQAPRPPHGGPRQTPAGQGLWIYGVHAVAAALGNQARRLRRLVLTEEGRAALAAVLPEPWAIAPELAPREKFDQLLGRGVVHQGIALQADPLGAPSLTEALKRPGPVLVLDQVTDPRNVGALLRTAQAFGAAMVIAQERNAPEENGALAKAASGALERMPLLRTVNIARALIALKAAGLWVVGLDGTAPGALKGTELGERRIALVLGNEGDGLRRLTRETCDELAHLAMAGGMESLNVSAAGAVAFYEITRK